ncbi:MAG TPA: glycosyltransferase family 2 protein [Candidatus Bathyarchaeia archaeon]|nr:glycosyltransferase family 2 protein [Candidatus Bathyarchaeia archaeon]
MKVDGLSVFFPAYNEEANIGKILRRAVKILPQMAKKWEILVINDGSTDRTGKIVEELIKKEPRIRMITHTPNRGYGATLKSGLYNSLYQLILFTDADGQFDFSEAERFLKAQSETKADLVIGYYLKRAVPFYRIWASRAWEMVIFLMFGLKVRDIDCGFKLLRKEVVEKISRLQSERGPFISSELLIKAKKAGFKIVELGVRHYPRKEGRATGASLRVGLSGFWELVKLKKKL